MSEIYVNHKKELSQNYTSSDLVKRLVAMLPDHVWSGAQVLEPSCGDGSIVKEVLARGVSKVVAIDIDPEPLEFVKKIEDDRLSCINADFLKVLFCEE
jgi:predicted RNA methylase